MSTLATVEQVMRQTKTPMSVRDIVEIAGDSLPTRSKTPDTVVARDLSMDIKRLGEESRFVRTAPGRYTMREFVTSGVIQMGDTGAKKSVDAPAETRGEDIAPPSPPQPAVEAPTPVLSQALGNERSGVLPATKVSEERAASRRAPTHEDATSL